VTGGREKRHRHLYVGESYTGCTEIQTGIDLIAIKTSKNVEWHRGRNEFFTCNVIFYQSEDLSLLITLQALSRRINPEAPIKSIIFHIMVSVRVSPVPVILLRGYCVRKSDTRFSIHTRRQSHSLVQVQHIKTLTIVPL
jgi:hypothetical protein